MELDCKYVRLMILKSIKDQTDCEHIESIVNFIDRVKSIPSAEMNNRTYQNQIQATSNTQLLQQELIDEQAAVVPYQASYLHPISAPGTPARRRRALHHEALRRQHYGASHCTLRPRRAGFWASP